MLYVGLTEDHRESATMFANIVGAQVISQALAWNSGIDRAADNGSGKHERYSFPFLNVVLFVVCPF